MAPFTLNEGLKVSAMEEVNGTALRVIRLCEMEVDYRLLFDDDPTINEAAEHLVCELASQIPEWSGAIYKGPSDRWLVKSETGNLFNARLEGNVLSIGYFCPERRSAHALIEIDQARKVVHYQPLMAA
jgi:hypothetical protein